jgi:hypothetical protein
MNKGTLVTSSLRRLFAETELWVTTRDKAFNTMNMLTDLHKELLVFTRSFEECVLSSTLLYKLQQYFALLPKAMHVRKKYNV